MTKAEFNRIVTESVDAGADREHAEAYVISGFKLPVDDKGKPVFDDAAKPAPAKKPAAKKKAATK